MIHSDSNINCFDWKSPPPLLPPRSRLYCLEPIGLGTPMVESLSGYVARLAEAHSTSTALLFGWELAPHLQIPTVQKKLFGSPKSRILATSFRSVSGAMNGIGVTAQRWIDALEATTMRRDLSPLTMTVWSEVFSHRHLLHRTHAWCAACYEEQRSSSRAVYDLLLWKLKIITACITHRRKLRFNCNHCGSHVYHLASHSRPGHCSNCRKWLGVKPSSYILRSERLSNDELERGFQLFTLTGEIIAAAPRLVRKPSKQAIAESTSYCVELAGGRILPLSNKHNFPKQTLGNWNRGEHVPQLGSLIQLCLRLKISPLKFATGYLKSESVAVDITEIENISVMRPEILRGNESSNVQRRHRKLNLRQAKQTLQAALQETIPPSVVEVARRIDRQPNTLRYHFPELCKAIVERHATYRKLRLHEEGEGAKHALTSALAKGVPITVGEVATNIGWSLNRLQRRFPALCNAVAGGHKEMRKSRWKEIERKLKAALKEQPPPPMHQVVERLNHSASSLYEHFPDLCREIGSRHLRYRKEVFEERRRQFLADIRKIALALKAEGIYPSVKRVEERLETPRSLRSSAIGLQLLREIRAELGLDSRRLYPTQF